MSDDLRDLLAEALERVDSCTPAPYQCRSHIDEALAREDAYARLANAILAALPPEAVQDWRDGRALRLARKALPEGLLAEWYPAWTSPWLVVAGSSVSGIGPTLAAAADKAREALG